MELGRFDWFAIVSVLLILLSVVLAALAVSVVWIGIALAASVVSALFSIKDSS